MKLLSKEQSAQMRVLILLTGVVTTLAIWTSLGDPINVPKLFVLSILSAWIFGGLLTAAVYRRERKLSLGQWSVLVFVLGLLISAFSTDVQYTAFYGTLQRNTGAIAYIALAILCFASMSSFDSSNLHRLRNIVSGTGVFLTLYGLLQIASKDPFHWNLVYGPVIGTLGNPDFMSATVGVTAIATAWFIAGQETLLWRIVGVVTLILELFVIRKSGSVQGIIAFAAGVSLLGLAFLWQRSRKAGLWAIVCAGLLAIPIGLGLLNSGPFASFMYRSSLKNRLDYWRAALSMFKAHPITGVGLERFFENYGVYAPQIQVVHGQPTNNAHNVFLQLLATGGLVVILPYLFLLGVIFYAGVKAIRTRTGQTQLDAVAVFSIWFALLLVSIVSIDNLGVVVWFWISGGVVYAVANNVELLEPVKKVGKGRQVRSKELAVSANATYLAPIVSLVMTIGILFLMVPMWRTSAAILDLQSNKSQLSPAQFLAKMDQVGKMKPQNPQTLYSLADIAMRIKNPELALKYVSEDLKADPKSNFGYQLGALARETEKKYDLAIPFRVNLIRIDPWNTVNMLQLVQDYVYLKDMVQAQEIASRISGLYPSSADAKAAAALVKG